MNPSTDIIQDSMRQSQGTANCTSIESTTMVPSIAATVVQHPLIATQGQGDNNIISTQKNFIMPTGVPQLHMAIVRQQCQSGGLSEAALQLLTASWENKTTSSCDFLFKHWDSWCQKQHRNPISDPLADIAIFWQSCLKKADH